MDDDRPLALVTGASSGIGYAPARQFTERGAYVAPGSSTTTRYTHCDTLGTLEALAGPTGHAGSAANAADMGGRWN